MPYKVTLVALSAALTFCGCNANITPTGPEAHETRSVNLDKSEKVRAALKMGAGELDVQGGAQQLLDGEFTYNVPSWKPDIRYQTSATGGDLVVEQPGSSSSTGKTTNHWDLRLNDGVPLDLRVHFGAGEARLKLGSLNLRSIDVEMGAGTIDMDLRGTPKNDYAVHIRGGVGEATVHLPRDAGISASASGGIGDISVTGLHKEGGLYVNDAYQRPGVRIKLDVQGGVGSIRLIAE